MKKLLILSLFLLPTAAFADISFTGFSANPASVAPGATTTLTLTVDRQPNTVTNQNDWESYKIVAFGNSGPCVDVDFTVGASIDVATSTLTATTTEGAHVIEARIYRENGCTALRDTATTSLSVVAPVTPSSPKPKSEPASAPQGGGRHPVWTTSGWYCPQPLRQENDPMGYCAGKYITSNTGAGPELSFIAQLNLIRNRLLEILGQLSKM